MKHPPNHPFPVHPSIPPSLRPSIRSITRLVSLTHRPPSPGPPARVRGQAGRGPHDAHRARRHSRHARTGQGAPRADRAAHRRGPRPTWARLHVDRLRRRPVARHGRWHAAGGGRLLVVHSRHRAGAPHMHAPCMRRAHALCTCAPHVHVARVCRCAACCSRPCGSVRSVPAGSSSLAPSARTGESASLCCWPSRLCSCATTVTRSSLIAAASYA